MSSTVVSWQSWADDGSEGELPMPPRAKEVSATPTPIEAQRRDYAKVVLTEPTASKLEFPRATPPTTTTWGSVEVASTTFTEIKTSGSRGPRVVRVASRSTKIEFQTSFACEGPARAPRAAAQRRTPVAAPVVTQVKCAKCQEHPGLINVTEVHSKRISGRLVVGLYCRDCVNEAAPTCAKEGCDGKRVICLPTAARPFTLFCGACMDAHRASLKKAASDE